MAKSQFGPSWEGKVKNLEINELRELTQLLNDFPNRFCTEVAFALLTQRPRLKVRVCPDFFHSLSLKQLRNRTHLR